MGAPRRESDSFFEIVWRQKAVVCIAVGVCLVGAVLYLLFATRYYSGYAKLFVQQTGPQILSETPSYRQETQTFLFTQREMILSTPVIAMALGTPGVRELRTFQGHENTFTWFKDQLSVEIGEKDGLLALQFDTPHREEAQRVVAALVDAYVEYQSKQRNSNASDMLTILRQERDKRVAALQAKQDELQAFRRTHGMSAGDDHRTDVVQQRLEKLAEVLTAAQLETISARTAFDDVRRSLLSDPARQQAFEALLSGADYSAPTAGDDAQLRGEMLQWQAYKQSLAGRYLPAHPLVKNAQLKIDQLNLLYAAAVHRRWEAAKQTEIDLQIEFDRHQQAAVAHNANALADARLAREVETLSAAAEELDKRIRDATVTQGGAAPSITVIEPASHSEDPIRPHTGPTLLLALLGGLVAGCGLACVRDRYDDRLRSADEIRAALGITVLGLIPRVNDETSPITRGRKVHIEPASDSAEAFRSLRAVIDSTTRALPARSILVTSPQRGDGKTTLASNLAISLAQAGRRVLIIDADLRAPMQDLVFSLNGRIGLANVLSDRAPLAVAIRHTGIDQLDLLPAGMAKRNPSELLNSQKFIDLLEHLYEKYEHLVIDSPPVLAVNDARIVAASADATLLVLRAGKSNRQLGEQSIDGLVSVGAKLLGAVVNDVQQRRSRSHVGYVPEEYRAQGGGDPSPLAEPELGLSETARAAAIGAAPVNPGQSHMAARQRNSPLPIRRERAG